MILRILPLLFLFAFSINAADERLSLGDLSDDEISCYCHNSCNCGNAWCRSGSGYALDDEGNIPNFYQWAPLLQKAIHDNNLVLLKKEVNKNNINNMYMKNSPLMLATRMLQISKEGDKLDEIAQREEIIKELLKYDPQTYDDGNASGAIGFKCLHCPREFAELVRLGLDIKSKANFDGRNYLEHAALSNSLDLGKSALKYGADPNTMIRNFPGKYFISVLEMAIRNSYFDMAKELLRYGADIDHGNYEKSTPLILATFKYLNEGNPRLKEAYKDFVKYLLANGADKNLKNDLGYTAYSLAKEYSEEYNMGDGIVELISLLNPHCPVHNIKNSTLKCGSCMSVSYCDKECQRLDWPKHRYICKELAPMKTKRIHIKQKPVVPVKFVASQLKEDVALELAKKVQKAYDDFLPALVDFKENLSGSQAKLRRLFEQNALRINKATLAKLDLSVDEINDFINDYEEAEEKLYGERKREHIKPVKKLVKSEKPKPVEKAKNNIKAGGKKKRARQKAVATKLKQLEPTRSKTPKLPPEDKMSVEERRLFMSHAFNQSEQVMDDEAEAKQEPMPVKDDNIIEIETDLGKIQIDARHIFIGENNGGGLHHIYRDKAPKSNIFAGGCYQRDGKSYFPSTWKKAEVKKRLLKGLKYNVVSVIVDEKNDTVILATLYKEAGDDIDEVYFKAIIKNGETVIRTAYPVKRPF